MASRDLLEFQGVRGNQLSLWNVHHVPLGIEARPDLRHRTMMGVEPSEWDGWSRPQDAGIIRPPSPPPSP